jgi:UDP-N-acetylmuramoyl-tripeptide--D-alanyl-D-alanine ligase
VIALSLGRVAEIVSGRLGGGADPELIVPGPVEFDSHAVRPGGLFLALPGERVDGHDFAPAAVTAGAVAALVTRPVDAPHILVGDGLAALAALAAASVRALPDLTVVGVTGSAGKTSTKDLLAVLLAHLGPTLAPRESFNNELGHPYTVLQAGADTRYLVLELSARGLGHIAALARVAPPRVGAVLNVGSAHLGEFGTRAAIAQAKGELVEALPAADAGGVAVLNADDPAVLAMAARTAARVVTFGTGRADVGAAQLSVDDAGHARFRLHTAAGDRPVRLGLVGAHHVGNALAAAAIALELGAGLDVVAADLTEARPRSRSRMAVSVRADGLTVIDDAYNANPESMRAALGTLAGMGRGRRTWAVLGHMAELGETSEVEHETIGRLAVRLGIGRLLVVGAAARAIADGAAREGGTAGAVDWVGDQATALALLRSQLRGDDVVLFKASHSVGLDRLAAVVRDDAPATAGPGGVPAAAPPDPADGGRQR